jgi:hypothetical protein
MFGCELWLSVIWQKITKALQKYIALSLMLRMKAVCYTEALVPTHQTTRWHSLQYHDINKKLLDVRNLIQIYSFENFTYQIQA